MSFRKHIVKDIVLHDFDLMFSSGDFVVDETTQSSIEQMLLSYPGNWRFSPLIGVGLDRMVNSVRSGLGKARFIADVTDMLEGDGLRVDSIDFTNGDLKIAAKRVK